MATLYPGALDTNDSLYVAVNGLRAFLAADITSTSTILNLTQSLPSNTPSTGYVTINGEAIHYGGKTSTSLTNCTRGQDGTSAAAHFKNDEVDFSPVADHHNAVVQAIFALEAKVGTGNAGQINGSQLVPGSVTKAKLAAGVGFAPLFFRAHLNNNIADTGLNQFIILDTVDQDDIYPGNVSGNYNIATGRWTAPAAGVAVVSWRVGSGNGPANNDSTGSIAVNGTIHTRGNEAGSPSANFNASVGSDMFKVNANDYIQLVRDYRSASTPIWGSSLTYLTIMFVSNS